MSSMYHAWAGLLLGGTAGVCFYPCLALAMTSMAAVCAAPERYMPRFAVRLGLYSGVVLAIQYIALLALSFEQSRWSAVAYCAVAAALLGGIKAANWALWSALRRWQSRRPRYDWPLAPGPMIVLAIAGVVGAIVGFPYILAFTLATAPVWTLSAFLTMSAIAYRSVPGGPQLGLSQLLGCVSWLAAYMASWRFAIVVSWHEYELLPTTPPACYIATAATRGHRAIVRSERIRLSGGRYCLINDQLRWLKAFELAIKAIAPGLHAMIRWVYDRVGPALASAIAVHPLLCDVAYLLLKPCDWIARGVLRMFVPDAGTRIAAFYRGGESNETRLRVSGS